MLSLATRYLPIFSLMAYVNEAYKAENLVKRFGRSYVFKLTGFSENPIPISAAFWFLVSIFLCYVAWFFIKRLYVKKFSPQEDQPGGEAPLT